MHNILLDKKTKIIAERINILLAIIFVISCISLSILSFNVSKKCGYDTDYKIIFSRIRCSQFENNFNLNRTNPLQLNYSGEKYG